MTFSIKASLAFGWEAFKRRPGLYIGSGFIYCALFLAIGLLTVFVDAAINGWPGSAAAAWEPPEESALGYVVDFGLNTLLNMGLTAFYLKAFDAPDSVSLSALWHPQRYWSYLFASLITGLAVAFGLILLVVPGVILGLMYLFGTFVVIDRSFGPINALEESRRITKGHRWRLLGFGLLLLLINLLGLLALVVGLLVTIPVTTLAFVYVYRLLQKAAGPSPYATESANGAPPDSELPHARS